MSHICRPTSTDTQQRACFIFSHVKIRLTYYLPIFPPSNISTHLLLWSAARLIFTFIDIFLKWQGGKPLKCNVDLRNILNFRGYHLFPFRILFNTICVCALPNCSSSMSKISVNKCDILKDYPKNFF